MKKLVILFIAIVGYTVTVNAQGASATTPNSVGATIVTPIGLVAGASLQFGSLSNTTAGTVVITPAGGRSVTGSVTATGTASAAAFTVTGGSTSTYTITLPASASTLSDGTHTMTVDTWTSNPSGTGTLSSGSQALAVGGTLHLALSQGVGIYTGSFSVTVNYN